MIIKLLVLVTSVLSVVQGELLGGGGVGTWGGGLAGTWGGWYLGGGGWYLVGLVPGGSGYSIRVDI